jgi:hypothetical protein
MVDIIPARPEMATLIDVQPEQRSQATVENLAALLDAGPGFAVVHGAKILAIGGTHELWRDRQVAWALLSRQIGVAMLPIHRSVERWFDATAGQRVEAYVDPTHVAAGRWVKMLGFEKEGMMRRFHSGRDYDLYARVK